MCPRKNKVRIVRKEKRQIEDWGRAAEGDSQDSNWKGGGVENLSLEQIWDQKRGARKGEHGTVENFL